MARFRLENKMREGRYWEREEKRLCRVCGLVGKGWRHILEDCEIWKAEEIWKEMVEVVLGEDDEGKIWMAKLEEYRRGCS